MLRALSGGLAIAPDVIVGTSVGAINGAFVAADPVGAAARLGQMWQGDAVRQAFSGTLLEPRGAAGELSARTCIRWTRCATCCATCFPRPTSPILSCPSTASRPASSVRRRAGSAAGPSCLPCWRRAPSPLLPPVEIDGEHFFDGGLVHSIPVGRAIALGASTVYVLHVGRIERPLTVPRRPWEVGLVAFEIARRHRFHEEMAALPADVRVHVLPAGTDRRPPDLSQLRYRDKTKVAASIERAYTASATVSRRAWPVTDPATRGRRSPCSHPGWCAGSCWRRW